MCKGMECGGLPPLCLPQLAADAGGASSAGESGGKPPQSKSIKPPQSQELKRWHHRPLHVFEPNQLYMVTAGTLHKQMFFKGTDRLGLLQNHLFSLSEKFGWELQAWVLFSNHYHFIAKAPDDAQTLKVLVRQFHSLTARELNRMDSFSGRKVWFQYWDTCLTYEKSYYARLNYVMNNPVHHGLVSAASAYKFCSAGWFETEAEKNFINKVKSYKYDQVKVDDEF
jgi:putative transposase